MTSLEQTLEKLLPVIVLLCVAMLFFRLGSDFQLGKNQQCYKVYLDSEIICYDCQKPIHGDTIRFVNRKHEVVGKFIYLKNH